MIRRPAVVDNTLHNMNMCDDNENDDCVVARPRVTLPRAGWNCI